MKVNLKKVLNLENLKKKVVLGKLKKPNLNTCIVLVILGITLLILMYTVFVHTHCYSTGHNYELKKTVEETCDKDGYKKYRCSTCLNSYKEVIGKSHDYKSIESVGNCDNNGYRVYECTRCQKTLKKNYTKCDDYKYIKSEGHCDNNGYKLYQCTKCGETKKEYYGKGHTYGYVKEEVVESTSKITYVCSKCNNTSVDEFKVSKNYISTLIMSKEGIKVKVYNGYKQGIVDAENSAACFKLHDKVVIADHKYQSFENLDKCEVGSIADFNSMKYRCINKFNGYNTGKDLTDGDNKSIKECKGDIVMYVGDRDSKNVTILIFSKIGII